PALQFLAGHTPPEPPPPASSVQKKAASQHLAVMQAIEQGSDDDRRRILSGERKAADLADDGVKRRVARRVLMGTFIRAFEQGRELMVEKKYQQAVERWNLATLAQPAAAEAWYNLAVSEAAVHDNRRAIDALTHAVENGFRDGDRIDHEALFNRL